MEKRLKEDDNMLPEDIIKFIKEIDEQIEKDRETIAQYGGSAATVLNPMIRLLMDFREMWINILLDHYGIFYIG